MSTPFQHWVTPTQLWHLLADDMPRATTPAAAPAPVTSAPVTRAPLRRPPPRPDHLPGHYIERRQLASELAKLTPEQREWFDEQMQVEKAIDPDGWLHRDVAVDLLIELDLNAT